MLRILVAGAVLLTAGCKPGGDASRSEGQAMTDSMTVTSDAFSDGATIPTRHTCDGEDVSPALAWSPVPDGTAAFAIVVDDPDARGFVHWLAADIGASRNNLDEGASGSSAGVEGLNDFGETIYRGPCPPARHRYVFEVFALSETLDLSPGYSIEDLRAAIDGKVLASGRLTGMYQRGG